jgi:hypothetical protein
MKKIEFEVKDIIVFLDHRSDTIIVHTTTQNPCWPYTGGLTFKFEVAQDRGADYVRDVFGIEPRIVS